MQSQGIFVETPKNCTLMGSELLPHQGNQMKGLVNANKIAKDKLYGKTVLIINGKFKGQKGRVVHVNGDICTLETNISAKLIYLSKSDLRDIEEQPIDKFDDNYHGDRDPFT